MLSQWMWYCYHDALSTELRQCRDEGRDVSALEQEANAIDIVTPCTEEEYQKVMEMVDRLEALPRPADRIEAEPDTLEDIHREQASIERAIAYDSTALSDQIRGAWIGRITGCLLGKPVEGWSREDIRKIAEADGNYPIVHYLHGQVPNPDEDPFFDRPIFKQSCFVENVHGVSPSDDDTNYTVLALSLVEQFGRDFVSENVVEAWMSNFPPSCLCTAEQAAFRNFLMHILPPRSGFVRNPYREWIGAQIRADFFGYINPGNPAVAADMAYRDACCTHTGNGIYGEMLAAAMIAQAFVTNDVNEIIRAGLVCIPQRSRLKKAIDQTLSMHQSGVSFEEMVDYIHSAIMPECGSWVHVIPNAMIVVAALLWGEGDYAKTLGLSVMAGLDTDCNGATVGSIMGILCGGAQIPAHFTDPIGDTLCTDIVGNARVNLTDLTNRTLKLMENK